MRLVSSPTHVATVSQRCSREEQLDVGVAIPINMYLHRYATEDNSKADLEHWTATYNKQDQELSNTMKGLDDPKHNM
ncbi:hypothetical protein MRB53_023996 [Persea americana]|uniref:Uncharacterized protein n=1 Tax=Persea americana TaxID=3435 RepID=A0ACC2LC60_PERAE|nr:hypothetical protein MRB53_023996 [Persea americana]